MGKYFRVFVTGFAVVFILSSFSFAQQTTQKKTEFSFYDEQDGYLDLSDFIIKKKGFVPVPIIITEPALGGFGLGFVPVFIQPNKPIKKDGKTYPVAPNMTVGMAAYTANGTYGFGGGTVGYIPKWGARYTVGGGYLNANMDYYFNLPNVGKDIQAEFNIESVPLSFSITKQLPDPRFSIGVGYMFMDNKIKIKSNKEDPWIAAVNDHVSDVLSGQIGKIDVKFQYDTRDNIFTPNNGFMSYVRGDWSAPAFGSDYNYGYFRGEAFFYFSPIQDFVTGLHFDIEQSVGDQPFYLKPYVNMRGVPTARFQGKSILVTEVEERWDFTPRFSVVGFGGAGKAFDDYGDVGSADWGWGYGAGLRYLIARKLNLRMGADVAMGPEGPAWYIIFGSSWMRD